MDKYYIKPDAWSKIYEILKENRKIRVKNEGKTRRFFEQPSWKSTTIFNRIDIFPKSFMSKHLV